MEKKHTILIIGGGTGGIMTAAQLKKKDKNLDIAILEPSEDHFYQPAWTLVGAGTYNFENTRRKTKDLIPDGVKWYKDYADQIDPDNNEVETRKNGVLGYEFLVVAPGLVMEPSMIKGLPEAFERGVALSNYINPKKTWEELQKFKGGNALFTQPATPIKCGGAPQKIAYLAADYFRKNNLSNKTNITFATPGSVIFGVKEIKATLEKVLNRYHIDFKPFHTPVEVDSDKKVVYFKNNAPSQNDCVINQDDEAEAPQAEPGIIEMPFDFLHLAPPQAAPKFIRESSLSNQAGWLDVDHYSLIHNSYSNVFGLGDVAALPTAKTGAAIRKQVPILVDNIMNALSGNGKIDKSYNGYSSCPLVTGYGKMTLAEFDYNNNFTPDPKLKRLLITDSSKEHWRLWMLKKYMLPYLYWNKMMKGAKV
ncbi:MAG: FAD/NAD(P)-binding oxidoreductase [Saprospiraceae bacterium]|nr:FAD/NAD(P)-binding oxidoreductase [Saprospiraceae bacterium]